MIGRLGALVASASLLATASLAMPVSPAGATPSPDLIAWTAQADANFVDLVVDNSSGLGGVHPLSELDIPEDTSDFETGPFGYGLATMFWPGAAAGNLGSVSGELGLPDQLAPTAAKLNDPARAEAFYPGSSSTAVYPAGAPGDVAEMTSHADGNGSSAKAGLSDVSVAGLLNVRSVQGSSTATATSSAQATSSGSFQSLSLLGGLIQVGASSSSASATSDGSNPAGSASTHIGGISVAGVPVSVGSDGLIVGPASSSAPGVLGSTASGLVNGLVSSLNLKMATLPESETRKAPAEQISSGGLQISFAIPAALNLSLNCQMLPSQLQQLGAVCDAPQELQGLSFTVTIGRVSALALSAPPFSTSLPFSSGASPPAQSALPVELPPGPSPIPGNPAVAAVSPPASTGTVPLATGGAPAQPGPVAPRGLSLARLATSTPVQAGMAFFLAVGVLVASTALRRMRRLLYRPLAAPCPLEDPR